MKQVDLLLFRRRPELTPLSLRGVDEGLISDQVKVEPLQDKLLNLNLLSQQMLTSQSILKFWVLVIDCGSVSVFVA